MVEKLKLKIASGNSMAQSMRTVAFEEIVEMVRLCCLSAATILPNDVLEALENEQYLVKVPDDIRTKALLPIERMLEIC